MASAYRLPAQAQQLLRCPVCHSTLVTDPAQCVCTNPACAARFPVLNGIPVLINEANSVFSIADFVEQRNTYFNLRPSRASRFLARITPSISNNIKARRNYSRFARLLSERSAAPTVLVLGGSITGHGMEVLQAEPALVLIESDVSFGPRTALICDGHDLPFAEDSLDGVVAQAVLEHVVDPHRVAAEIHRVLKPTGLVYAETPFMQQMHGGRYDFERFTCWGHRRLFRRFEEVESGLAGGPGMALAWSYTYFLLSFARSRPARAALNLFAGLTSFYLKYFDHLLIDRPGARAAAAGYYFLGRKSQETLADRELIHAYKVVD